MRRALRAIDALTGATGFVGACLVVPLFFIMTSEVVLRFVFDRPTFWAYELAYMLTGAHFALGIAYVLREDAHVRVDFVYARLGPRTRAAVDLAIYLLFLLPLMVWMTMALIDAALSAYSGGQVSGESAWNPLVWPLYATVAFGFAVFCAQIAAEVVKKASLVCGYRTPP